jgi:prolipoprotein diacylglyceryl transferase
MYPDFSYIFHDLFGTAPDNGLSLIKTFGFFLAMAILASSYFLYLELKRKEENGTLVPIQETKKGKTIWIKPHDKTGDITLVAAFSGIAGAKIFALFESAATFKAFLRDPVHTLFSGSGLAIYGGLIVAFIVVTWYVKRLGIKPIHLIDATAPSLMVGYGVGRLGCHFSGDGDWGIVAMNPKPGWASWIPDYWWSNSYPRNVLNEGTQMADCIGNYCHQLVPGVYPTPLYEFIMAGIIFAILWSLRKRLVRAGQLFFLYCFLNGIERFSIEKIRVNDKIHFAGLTFTQAEMISFLLIFIGIIGFIICSLKKPDEPVQAKAE